MPPDLRELAQSRADEEHRNLSDVANSALRAYLTGDDGGEARKHTIRRLAELEAELERTRAELEAARQGVIRVSAEGREKQARAGLRQVQEDRFIAALEAATKEDPATAPRLAALSGYSKFWCRDLCRALEAAGFLGKVADGQWVAVPGRDLRAGMREARAIAQTGAARIAPSKREAPPGSSPATVPPVAAAKATDVAGAHSAAKGNGIARAAKRAEAVGAPLVAAKDLPRPGAGPVFQAGPDVDCLHENMRIRKGVCPDCKQWVTK
jgi:hypothetical protein